MAHPEKIGKYQILERIGRGGMGTIFKAHDPILNRLVALKVISTDVDLTEDIRHRFFREAQACARLSHPNIITVYDIGEDDGRMFIVMELLEGTELRRFIADHAPLALEDKLSIMSQVCDGLHYAHQRGIVHRDIKPSNIMRLPSGQVKILDFGIAQMESFHETLTRTGLIMGTLRYMAPEQVQGRADHRADIFSVGAVLYEFLSSRPPFRARDALHLLEQLRTEDPTPLHVVDPTIPSELSGIAARAMQKDPAARTPDLAQMRAQIEQMQRALAEEARHVQARIRTQREQLQRLEAAVARVVGSSTGEVASIPDDPRHLAGLQALEADLLARSQAAKDMLARATALAPAFERATELLEGGQLSDAIVELEVVVAEMPEHARAAAALASARARADEDRRRQVAVRLMQEARAALAASRYTLCLDLLEQVAAIPPPAEALPEISALRDTAEAAAAMQDAAPGAREQSTGRAAEAAEPARAARQRERMQGEKDHAAVAEAPARPVQSGPIRTGRAAPVDEMPAHARGGRWIFSVSVALGVVAIVLFLSYSRSPHVGAPRPVPPPVIPATPPPASSPPPASRADAGNASARGPAEPTREEPSGQERAAPERSTPAGEGESEPAKVTPTPALPARRAEDSAAEGPPAPGRPDTPQAESQPSTPVGKSEPAKVTPAPALPPRRAEDGAVERPPAPGRPDTRQAESQPSTPLGKSEVAKVTPEPALPARHPADRAVERPPAPGHPDTRQAKSQPSTPVGKSEIAKVTPEPALPARRAGDSAVERPPAAGHPDTRQAESQMATARIAAEKTAAAFYAPVLLAAAQAREREADDALHRSDFTGALRLLADARSGYQAAAQEARRQADRERQIAPLKASVAQARDTALARRRQALAAGAERLAMDLLRAAEAQHAEADSLAAKQSLAAALRAYSDAAQRYSDAELQARAASGK